MTKFTIEILAENDRWAFRHLRQLMTLIGEAAVQDDGNIRLTRGDNAYSTSDVGGSSACHVSDENASGQTPRITSHE